MTIKAHLRANNINEFKSIKELMNFQKSYSILRQEIISHHSVLIEQERENLRKEIAQLNEIITRQRSEVEQALQFELDQLNEQLARLVIGRCFFGTCNQ